MASDTFLTVADVVIAPVDRSTQQDITPSAVTPDKVTSVWIQFDPQIKSLWAQTRSGSGGSLTITPHDMTQLTPGFSIGDGTVTAKYLKRGRFVIVKVCFVIGAATKINGLVLDQSFSPGEVYGETGVMAVTLPFPSAGIIPYSFGTYGFSDTAVTSGGVLNHSAQIAFSFIDLLKANISIIILPIWEFDAGSPTSYSSNTPFQRLWTPGDFFDVQFEYETDQDD